MASDGLVEISVDAGELFRPDETRTVAGGGTRLVKMVPVDNIGKTRLPCIWRSRVVTDGFDIGGGKIRVNACLLLVSKNPPTVLAAEVAVDAWQHFPEGPVEW
jgi:hypothetical protein